MLGIRNTNSKAHGLHNNTVIRDTCMCTLFPIK